MERQKYYFINIIYLSRSTALNLKSIACNATGQLHNDIILLQLHVPESPSLNKLLGLLLIKPQQN